MATATPVAPPPSITRKSGPTDPIPPLASHGGEDEKHAVPSRQAPTSPTTQNATTTAVAVATRISPRSGRQPMADFLSDKSTAALIRRVLCPQVSSERGRNVYTPIEDLLPPLTSRNDVDLQLYALISIILRESVQNWYGKITPDETFIAEIVQIIAHCTRALEQRLRKVDLESLLLDELPDLFDAHVRAYRIAKHASAARPPLESSLRVVYHSLWPLPALSPVPHGQAGAKANEQAKNEGSYRQLLVQGVLALLLPTEDLQNECLESIVRQILSELIIGSLMVEKLAQPWLLWEIIIILTKLGQKGEMSSQRQHSDSQTADTRPKQSNSLFVRFFWSIMQGIFLFVNIGRLLFSIVSLSRSLPPRTSIQMRHPNTMAGPSGKTYAASISSEICETTPEVPVASFAIWSSISNLVELRTRMPWLGAFLALLQHAGLSGPGQVANVDGVLDRLMSHCIQTYMLAPALLPPLLRSVRGALYPNNAPGTSTLSAPSSDEEVAALKRRCARAVWGVIPERVGRIYYGANAWAWLRSPLRSKKAESDDKRSGPPEGTLATDPTNADRMRPTGLAHHQQQHSQDSRAHVTQPTNTRRAKRGEPAAGSDGLRNQQRQEAPRTTPGEAGPSVAHDGGSSSGHRANSGDDVHDGNGGDDAELERVLAEIESGILDVFSDPYCNKHLLYSILELILVRLMPELTERGVVDLLEERLV